jgi:hypothetical protein
MLAWKAPGGWTVQEDTPLDPGVMQKLCDAAYEALADDAGSVVQPDPREEV